MADIGGGWYMEKSAKGLPPLKRKKLSKKAQQNQDKIQNIYMNIISGGMIVNSNYIGTSLNGWIQKISSKEINPIQFLQKRFT